MTDEGKSTDWTAPPTETLFPAPEGAVSWAPVYFAGAVVGAVWIAEQPTVPRAGILLTQSCNRQIQDDLGEVTLRLRSNKDTTPVEFLEHLAETRTGIYGKVAVGDAVHGSSLDAARQFCGHLD